MSRCKLDIFNQFFIGLTLAIPISVPVDHGQRLSAGGLDRRGGRGS